MSFFIALIEWTKIIFLPFGALGLFIIAFMESSFFPIPPDLLLIPMVLVAPELWWFYASICTIGSVAGAAFDYWIGKKGGRPVLRKLVSNKNLDRVDMKTPSWLTSTYCVITGL